MSVFCNSRGYGRIIPEKVFRTLAHIIAFGEPARAARARRDREESRNSTMIRAVSGSVVAAARAGPLRAVAASRGLSSLVPLDEEYMG